MQIDDVKNNSWLDRPIQSVIQINWETTLFTILIVLGLISRLYMLGARVMSHDETSHVYFSWLYEQGHGYSHDPVTHGPLQFHLLALSYFLIGDSDFSARLPAALFGTAAILFMWYFRRFLGRAGALFAAAMMLISPYLLYYARYARNEAFISLFGPLMIWAMLRYIESGENRHLYWLTAATVLHFIAKETAFIYAAQALLFLAGYLVYRLLRNPWRDTDWRRFFIIALVIALVCMGAAGGLLAASRAAATPSAENTAIPAVPGTQAEATKGVPPALLPSIFLAITLLALIAIAYFTIRGYGWDALRKERSFSMLIVLGTLVLPILSAFPVKFLGINAIDYQNSQTIAFDTIFVGIFALVAVAVGLAWNPRLWLANAILFYAIFTVFYTSIFTNGFGFFTGLVGSLGYWLEQQGVNRGSQPWYFYALIQIPMYEFLPALGTIAAFFYVLFPKKGRISGPSPAVVEHSESDTDLVSEETGLNAEFEDQPSTFNHQPSTETPPTIALLLYWSITSLLAYSVAGEKMPWLTVHIALPMILTAGWYLGKLTESIDWTQFLRQKGILVILVLPVFITSLLAAIGQWLGTNPPFQGKELDQLQATSTFITALLTAIASGIGLSLWIKSWRSEQFQRVLMLTVMGLLGLLTVHAAIRASYINYDNATEYLVYAHMARGPKEALAQIEEISKRTTNGLALRVAYDDETSYPFWWYLRNYTNVEFFGKNPTRAERDAVAILVGDANYGKIEPVVGQAYQSFEYTRIWWPNQEYFGLTWQRLLDAVSDPLARSAIFQVWLNRDFTQYGVLINQDLSLPNWQPSHKFRLYIRKDVLASLWNYGAAPAEQPVAADPYAGKEIKLTADGVIGSTGTQPGQFNRPRGVAVAPDGTVYVADTENHRIQHLAADGSVLQTWGSFSASTQNAPAPEGLFNEPWGIAVGPDGSVYVADTWNHRIQKFTSDGKFIKTWGFGISQTDDPFGFYGPRAVAVNAQGDVFVTDTGNKRIVVFDSDGNFLTKFGETGLGPGQFDEPVGLAVDKAGQVYVADTWNQRIQVFTPAGDGSYQPVNSWDVAGWYGQSLDNKPYIAVDDRGHVFAADPEGYRILEFTTQGDFVQFWGDYSTGLDGFDLPSALAADPNGGVWVSDTNNGRLLHFTLPGP
jgi:uncharacterized protein (TIGR03663 family)